MRACHLQSHQKATGLHRDQPRRPFSSTMRRLALGAAVAAAWLLSACSGMPSFSSGDDAAKAEAAVRYASAKPASPKRSRFTTRDIMLEWATLSSDRAPYKRNKGLRASPLDDVLEEPDITLSIREIMANAACRSCDEKPYHPMVLKASKRHGVPTSLIHAVIQKESAYNPAARSHKRARGLMQVTPETARFVGVRNSAHLYDPQTNIDAGTAYLKYLMGIHATFDEVLAAYNAGPGNVRKYKGVPPFRETQRYVRDVKKLYSVTSR
jgi:soluble lytic murein transglycosylase-like protein